MPSDVRYSEVKKLLESNGWHLDRIRGSHHVFTRPGKRNIIIPIHGKNVRYVYVRQIQKIIEEERD
jgi:predicted RNA binding protein YcfA (HicA-like mRNA interferase family)